MGQADRIETCKRRETGKKVADECAAGLQGGAERLTMRMEWEWEHGCLSTRTLAKRLGLCIDLAKHFDAFPVGIGKHRHRDA